MLGGVMGSQAPVHPNDHVNKSQVCLLVLYYILSSSFPVFISRLSCCFLSYNFLECTFFMCSLPTILFQLPCILLLFESFSILPFLVLTSIHIYHQFLKPMYTRLPVYHLNLIEGLKKLLAALQV